MSGTTLSGTSGIRKGGDAMLMKWLRRVIFLEGYFDHHYPNESLEWRVGYCRAKVDTWNRIFGFVVILIVIVILVGMLT
jgi:hypothetical protein